MSEATSPRAGSWDPTWEAVFRAQEWGKYPPEHVIRFVACNWYSVPDRRTVRLLDLGCGPGACTWYMGREGFTVSAIDGSSTAIAKLQARLAGEGLSADAQVGDYLRLPWPDATFDGVIDNVSLYSNTYGNCVAAVAEVCRVLKPGGRFLSVNFTPRTWGYGLGRKLGLNEFADITEGPLAGKGLSLFMDDAQASKLYGSFEEVATDLLSYTIGGMQHVVELRIVTCRKPR